MIHLSHSKNNFVSSCSLKHWRGHRSYNAESLAGRVQPATFEHEFGHARPYKEPPCIFNFTRGSMSLKCEGGTTRGLY
jgi:hypothetical protein